MMEYGEQSPFLSSVEEPALEASVFSLKEDVITFDSNFGLLFTLLWRPNQGGFVKALSNCCGVALSAGLAPREFATCPRCLGESRLESRFVLAAIGPHGLSAPVRAQLQASSLNPEEKPYYFTDLFSRVNRLAHAWQAAPTMDRKKLLYRASGVLHRDD